MSATFRLVFLLSLCACSVAPNPKPAHNTSLAHHAPERATPATSQALSRPPSAAEQATIGELMHVTERIRGLSFVAPIEVRIENREAMRAYVSAALREPELERARRRYVALGVIDATLDVRRLLEALMEEELIGYYDPKRKLLAVRDDVARSMSEPRTAQAEANLEWRATVVHELVHALQDQHLGLGEALERERTTDADDAFGALVEGDATMAMMAYASDTKGDGVLALARDRRTLRQLLRAAPETLTGALRAAPSIVREPLLFRYREGALFAADLVRAGGYERVDAAYRAPPLTTRDIVDSSRFLAGSSTREPELPVDALLAAAVLTKQDEDTLGSFELGIVLSDDEATSQALALSWRADRYAVFEADGALGVVWVILADSSSSARRIEDAANASAPKLERGGRFSVLRRGRYVAIVRRCSEEQVAAVQAALDEHTLHKREP